MAENIISKIVLRVSRENQIKKHHVYKNKWNPKLGGHLKVQCELENPVDK